MLLIAFGSDGGEKEISSISAGFVEKCLREKGVDTCFEKVEISQMNFYDIIQQYNPTCVFNAMHGTFGEDGAIQHLLDINNIPYTHSGAMSSFICISKFAVKSLLSREGILFPSGFLFNVEDIFDKSIFENIKQKVKIGMLKGSQFIIKPNNLGSSLYVFKIDLNNREQFEKDAEYIKKEYNNNINNATISLPKLFLAEEIIEGREFDVTVFDATEEEPIVGVAEIMGEKEVYTYEKKYHSSGSVVNFEPNINKSTEEILKTWALRMHTVLQCKDLTRSEFIVRQNALGKDEIYTLEINTHPGLRENSCAIKIPEIVANIPKEEIIHRIIKRATFRHISK